MRRAARSAFQSFFSEQHHSRQTHQQSAQPCHGALVHHHDDRPLVAQLPLDRCHCRDAGVKRAVDYLKAHSLNTVEDLNQAIDSLNQTAAPLRKQLKQNENRMRAIAQIKDAAAVHAKLKPIHDIFIKKNFKLTKDAYAAQHKEELDTFNKAVRTLMKLNGRDRKSTRLNSSHIPLSRMPSSA